MIGRTVCPPYHFIHNKVVDWERRNLQKEIRYLCVFIFLIVGVVFVFGRVEFHNELQKDVQRHVFLGYLDGQQYQGKVHVLAEQWPLWTADFETTREMVLDFAPDKSGRIGIFADLVYYENRYERRVWFIGRLLEQDSEYYYRQDGPLYLETVYEPQQVAVHIAELRSNAYDYQSFCGED